MKKSLNEYIYFAVQANIEFMILGNKSDLVEDQQVPLNEVHDVFLLNEIKYLILR